MCTKWAALLTLLIVASATTSMAPVQIQVYQVASGNVAWRHGKEVYSWNARARADPFKSALARYQTRAFCELWLSTVLRLIRFVECIKSCGLASHYCENLVQSGYIEDSTYSIITAADDESMTATDD